MKIRFNKAVIEEIDDGNLKRFGFDLDEMLYGKNHIWLDAEEMNEVRAKELHGMLSKAKAFGSKAARGELGLYLKLLEEVKQASGKKDGFANARINKVEHLATYLRHLFKPMKQHRVYGRDASRGVMFCYYLYDIRYVPASESRRSDYVEPEHVIFTLAWKEFGEERSSKQSIYYDDCVTLNIKEVFRRRGLFLPDTAQDEQYEEGVERFNKIMSHVGEQYLASGTGTDDVDSSNSRSSYWWRNNNIILDRGGEPSQVVIDVFKESDEEDRRRNSYEADMAWWKRLRLGDDIEEDPDDDGLFDSEGNIATISEQLPIHPNLVIFALKKQVRLRVHVDQLVKYKYDKSLGEKLILPQESLDLVTTLVNWKGGFQDIVKNKGGGAVVLSTGEPGTGKTLTAEVYAEIMGKPLYNVQCSQLGTDPEGLEKELLTIFSRSERWSAILLLDEADVYIRTRGDDLNQNAIVGVFLRVLEYYHGVLFMTTNRPDIVDDAIASRCIARIHYEKPTPKNAAKIWRVLADVQGVRISNPIISQLIKKYKHFSGRDIKNVIKLVKLLNGDKSVTMSNIDFAAKFKPTE